MAFVPDYLGCDMVCQGTVFLGGSGGTAAYGERGGAAEIGCTLVGQKYGRGFLRSRALFSRRALIFTYSGASQHFVLRGSYGSMCAYLCHSATLSLFGNSLPSFGGPKFENGGAGALCTEAQVVVCTYILA